MSRDWTPEEIQMVSKVMKAAGHQGYEEFCAELAEQGFIITQAESPSVRLQLNVSEPDM